MLIVLCRDSYAQRFSKDFLVRSCDTSEVCGYANAAGVMVIPAGKYFPVYTDTFRRMAIVGDSAHGIIAINRHEKMLYQVHIFDNGPDYPSEGVYRIKKGDKFGFANEKGIVVRPRFDFVYPFQEGYAVFVMGCSFQRDHLGEHIEVVGGKYGYIDHKGKIVQPAIYDYAESFDENEFTTVIYKGRPMKVDKTFIEIVGK